MLTAAEPTDLAVGTDQPSGIDKVMVIFDTIYEAFTHISAESYLESNDIPYWVIESVDSDSEASIDMGVLLVLCIFGAGVWYSIYYYVCQYRNRKKSENLITDNKNQSLSVMQNSELFYDSDDCFE